MTKTGPSPLNGVKIVEFAGIGPVPFCGMLLADMGADVVRIDRPGSTAQGNADIQGRGKRSIAIDLKSVDGQSLAQKLCAKADILMEGFRPGVMERLNLGPATLLPQNHALIYGRMTGWGQDGPMAKKAGHDINYIALTGALGAMGQANSPPSPPLNLLGDYGGGALYLAMGLLAAHLQAQKTGAGQVVDAAIVDGTASLMTPIYWLMHTGMWQNQRERNLLDGSAHFYTTYVCKDGKYISVGAIEPKFYNMLCDTLDLEQEIRDQQFKQDKWPVFKARLAGIFAEQKQSHWNRKFAGTDACIAPVEDMLSSAKHPHIKARNILQTGAGDLLQPAPAPRFSSSKAKELPAPPDIDANRKEIMQDWDV